LTRNKRRFWLLTPLDLRRRIAFLWLVTVLLISLGVVFATMHNAPAWVDKAGKLVVVASLAATYLQFRYEASYARRVESWSSSYMQRCLARGLTDEEGSELLLRRRGELQAAFEYNRKRVLMSAIAIAAVGESLSAFGGLLYSFATSLL
jgi:hypothetical protein